MKAINIIIILVISFLSCRNENDSIYISALEMNRYAYIIQQQNNKCYLNKYDVEVEKILSSKRLVDVEQEINKDRSYTKFSKTLDKWVLPDYYTLVFRSDTFEVNLDYIIDVKNIKYTKYKVFTFEGNTYNALVPQDILIQYSNNYVSCGDLDCKFYNVEKDGIQLDGVWVNTNKVFNEKIVINNNLVEFINDLNIDSIYQYRLSRSKKFILADKSPIVRKINVISANEIEIIEGDTFNRSIYKR